MRLFLPHTWSPPPQRGLLHHHPPTAQHTTCSGIQTQGKLRPRSPTGHPAQLPFWPILYTRGHLSAQNLHPRCPPAPVQSPSVPPALLPGTLQLKDSPTSASPPGEAFILHSFGARLSADAGSRMVSKLTALWPCPRGMVIQGAGKPESAHADG